MHQYQGGCYTKSLFPVIVRINLQIYQRKNHVNEGFHHNEVPWSCFHYNEMRFRHDHQSS